MPETPYTLVFEKLAEAEAEILIWPSLAEADDIDELRRLSLEMTMPEPVSYTVA
jgi:hypothetical protein